jgi:hypothetical protein
VATPVERHQRRQNCSPERRHPAAEEVVAAEGSRVWEPNYPPQPLLIAAEFLGPPNSFYGPGHEFGLRSGPLSA